MRRLLHALDLEPRLTTARMVRRVRALAVNAKGTFYYLLMAYQADRVTGSKGAAEVADALASPIRIVFIVLVALLATWIGRRLVNRLARRLRVVVDGRPVSRARSAQRAETIATVLRYVISVTIWSIALITILGELGLELAPLLAGAGVAGVALGFGAQSVVRDFLSGLFMLAEDQLGVGDVVDLGDAKGTVEDVSLRVTQVRDADGTLWHVPNGEIKRVANRSQPRGAHLASGQTERRNDAAQQ